MSGIAGLLSSNDSVHADHLDLMIDQLAHRGPDGISTTDKGPLKLAHLAFHTTSEAQTETFPIIDDERALTLVMDGRIDNRESLTEALGISSERARLMGDGAFVLEAFKRWNKGFLERLSGDFSIALWDGAENHLLLARDHNGNRPLYYHFDGHRFAFASEPAALIALPWVNPVLNEDYVADYLSISWHSRTETLWRNISRVTPAHMLTLRPGKAPQETQYWSPDLEAVLPVSSDQEAVEYYDHIFKDIVRRMSRSHAPLAFEVSGGLDSSSLFSVGRELQADGNLNAPDANGYTLDFRGAGEADEMVFVDVFAQHLGVSITEAAPTIQPPHWYQAQAKKTHDFPGYPNGIMAMGLRERALADGSRSIITGVGGDEWSGLFSAGTYYREAIAQRDWSKVTRDFRHDVGDIGFPAAARLMVRRGVVPQMPDSIKHRIRGKGRERFYPWLSAEYQRRVQDRDRAIRPIPGVSFKHQSQFAILLEAYSSIAREAEERLAAQQGIEIRSPYLSKDMIQFSFSADASYLNRGSTFRWLHRQCMRNRLPEVVRTRTSKADFMNVFQTSLNAIPDIGPERLHAKLNCLDLNNFTKMKDASGKINDIGINGWVLWSIFCCNSLIS
ncbi:MAG: asparagine synthase-related protein [Pseudomonadota bacterium]